MEVNGNRVPPLTWERGARKDSAVPSKQSLRLSLEAGWRPLIVHIKGGDASPFNWLQQVRPRSALSGRKTPVTFGI